MVTLALSTWIPGLQPAREGDTANWLQNLALYGSLYIVALGTGGIKPNVSAFGADQFDMTDAKVCCFLRHSWQLILVQKRTLHTVLGPVAAWTQCKRQSRQQYPQEQYNCVISHCLACNVQSYATAVHGWQLQQGSKLWSCLAAFAVVALTSWFEHDSAATEMSVQV